MSEPLAYCNGQFLPQSRLAIPFHDAGFVFGATVTDLVRTFNSQLFRLAEHLARFRHSCTLARIPLLVPDERLTEIAEHLTTHNTGLLCTGQDLALVLFATPGSLPHYAGLAAPGAPMLGLHTFPLPFARYVPFLKEGVRLVVPSVRAVPGDCVDPGIKQRSRLHWWLAEHEVRSTDPSAMALLLDHAGHVTETASSNLVLVRKGTVTTPPRTAVLPGVSLRVVEELCGQLSVPFEEQPLTPHDCVMADEVLVTCTSFCLAGVNQFQGNPIPWPGKMLRRLADAWSQHVGLDIHGQILASGL